MGMILSEIQECRQAASTEYLATRRNRRKALKILIAQLEAIADAERAYMNRVPENLRGATNYEIADQAVSALEEALDSLDEVY